MSEWLPGATATYHELPALRMHTIHMGPEDGEPIILLHGFPEFWYSWRYQIPALAEAGYRVIVPDQRGYNLTSKVAPYDIETLVGDAAALMDALHLERAHIAGHDWGGVVAWAFAALRPERTLKLCVMNAPHPNAYLDTCKKHWGQIAKSWYIYFFQLPAAPELLIRWHDYWFLERAFADCPPEYMTPRDVRRYKEAMARPGALTAAINWYRAMARTLAGLGFQPPVYTIKADTLVIWGAEDDYLHIGNTETLAPYVEQLRVEILPGVTHWVQMHDPETVNRHMLDFLGSAAPSSTP